VGDGYGLHPTLSLGANNELQRSVQCTAAASFNAGSCAGFACPTERHTITTCAPVSHSIFAVCNRILCCSLAPGHEIVKSEVTPPVGRTVSRLHNCVVRGGRVSPSIV